MSRPLLALLLAVLVPLLGACSFALIAPPTPSEPACTESQVVPTFDVLVALAAVAVGVGAAVGCANADDENDVACPLAFGTFAVAVPTTLVFGASASGGFEKTRRCRAQRRAAAR